MSFKKIYHSTLPTTLTNSVTKSLRRLSVTQAINNTIIIIPSLNPSDKLITYVNSLKLKGFEKILIINDGSSTDYDPVFKTFSKIKDYTVFN